MAAPFNVQAGDIVELSIFCALSNQVSINRLHYTVGNLNQPAQGADDFALAFFNYVTPFYKQVLTSVGGIINTGVRRIIPAPVTVEVYANPPAPVLGTGGNAPLPGQVTGMITKRTGLAGRSNRGRVYVAFPDDSMNDQVNVVPTNAYKLNLATLALQLGPDVTLLVNGTQYTLFLALYHRKTNTVTLVQSIFARPKWATQRRRGNYGRPNIQPA